MRPHFSTSVLVLLAACAAPVAAPPASGRDEREQLQAAHDATLQLEVHGRLDAAAIARGVAAAQAFWGAASEVIDGEVDPDGVLRVRLPAISIRTSFRPVSLHLVDRAGVHWYCSPDLTATPPTGSFDLGELQLRREPDSPTVVDDVGHPLPAARVLLRQGADGADLETVTDERGHACLCRAAPFDDELLLVVHHPDFAPWWGPPASRVQLDHGGEVHGRVVLPPDVDAGDFVAAAWIDEAAPRGIRGDDKYADVTAPLASDGSYRLRNLPRGTHRITVADRHSIDSRGGEVEVEVGATPVTTPDLELDDTRSNAAMRIHLVDQEGRGVLGQRAEILVSDVGIDVPLHNGFLDWVEQPDRQFAFAVPGYAVSTWATHHTGETITLRGGHRVTLHLALDSARQLPPGSALDVGVVCLEDDATGFGSTPIDYPNGSTLAINRNTDVVVTTPGRYRVTLELLRWDAEAQDFIGVPIDAAPQEFVVPAAAERTVVLVHTDYHELPR